MIATTSTPTTMEHEVTINELTCIYVELIIIDCPIIYGRKEQRDQGSVL